MSVFIAICISLLHQLMLNRTAFVLLFFVLIALSGRSQSLSNLRNKTFTVASDSLKLDSLSLVPGQVFLYQNGIPVDTSAYTLYPFQSLLIWKQKPVGAISVRYRVYPFALGQKRFRKDYAGYRESQSSFVMRPYEYKAVETAEEFFDFGTLDYNGTFSRGLQFGNNQDVVLNSQFNLQLSGEVAKDLDITAALTDNNVPFQPDGNTQQIQEFDKIFIQLQYKKKHRLTAGDFDLFNTPQSHFLKFSKKPQGGWYQGDLDFKEWGKARVNAAGGIMRGKFARNTLAVREGNQGPYKLFGANGESFIVILANTEEVFINNVKMQRGADQDYVIDYNTAEIRFTPKRIITRDLRVVVEFEYTNNNFLRSVVFANAEWETKYVNTRLNIYSEQDSKNQTIAQSYDDNKRSFLSTVGDSVQNAFYPTVDSVLYDVNRILYALKDTLGYDSVLVFSNEPAVAYYTAAFTMVGDEKGDYVPTASLANGRVFVWVKPDTIGGVIVKRGNYTPAILLPAPQISQMYTLATDFKIAEKHIITTEGALSNNDVNTLSPNDNADNFGGAAKINYKGSIDLKRDTVGKSQSLNIEAGYEFVQSRFRTVERFRTMEFNREWNTAAFVAPGDEHLTNVLATYNIGSEASVNYRFRSYLQQNNFTGFENGIGANMNKKDVRISSLSTIMNGTGGGVKSLFIRPQLDINYGIKKAKGFRIGAEINHEINEQRNAQNDSLNANSYLWQNYKVYLVSPDSMRNKFGVEGVLRMEHKGVGKRFDNPFFYGQTVNVFGNINTLKNQTLNYTLSYRYAYNQDSAASLNYARHYYLGRIDYTFNLWKGLLRSTTLYEIGSGREQKIQLTYQTSPTNTGDFVWKDANDDGIKQLDEFVISPFREDSSYIKVFAVTPESVPVSITNFTQTLNVNPAVLLGGKAGKWARFGSRFSLFASMEIQKKTFAQGNKNVGNIFNPFPTSLNNSLLVSIINSNRASLYFNRLDPKYGAQFDFSYIQSKVLLTSGYEERLSQAQGVTLRYNIITPLTLQTIYTNGTRSNTSDFYILQRYRFYFNQTNTEFSYQYKTDFRISLNYLFAQKTNPSDSVGKQTASINQAGISGRYNRSDKLSFEAKFTYASILYRDKDFRNQQLEYAMLEGLQNGNNLVWSAVIEYRVTQSVLLTFVYDGRKTGTAKPIHSGRAELRAIF